MADRFVVTWVVQRIVRDQDKNMQSDNRFSAFQRGAAGLRWPYLCVRQPVTMCALNAVKLPVFADSSGTMVLSTALGHLIAMAVFAAHYGR